jgi:hypothetical protein
VALWEGRQASDGIYAKDIFHSEAGRGYTMKVLRDGSLEMVTSFSEAPVTAVPSGDPPATDKAPATESARV